MIGSMCRFKDSFFCICLCKHCFQCGKIVRRGGSGICHPDLHDRASVGTVAGLRGRCATLGSQVRITRVVVIAWVGSRESCGSVVVKNESFPGILGKVNDDICPFCSSEQQRVLIDISEVEICRIHVPCDRLAGYYHRCRQETAFGTDLNPVRSL